MGVAELLAGNNGDRGFVRLFGYQESVSLDTRGRFRLPDDLAAAVHRELGRARRAAGADMPAAAYERLSFYLAPGTRKRIFVYPIPNADLAVRRFENPPPGMDPEVIRQARDYFYNRVRFVEADKQNRLVIPEGLRQHADIDEQVQQITLVAQNYWLTLSRTELVEQRAAEEQEAFEQVAPDLLDPVYRTPPESSGIPPSSEDGGRSETDPQQ